MCVNEREDWIGMNTALSLTKCTMASLASTSTFSSTREIGRLEHLDVDHSVEETKQIDDEAIERTDQLRDQWLLEASAIHRQHESSQ